MSVDPLVRRLLSDEAYQHPVDDVRLVETHISWVFLTGRFAYKVKKPVDLGFLDFSTLKKRRHSCHEEVRLNRRFAPSLYLGAVPITGEASEAVIDGGGEPTEWAVQLVQFDEACRLDSQLERGELSLDDSDQLGREIAEVQRRLEVAGPETSWGTAETVRDTISMNLCQLREHRHDAAERVEALQQWVESTIAARADRFHHRRAAGRVRQCHGDLHLANLVRLEGRFVAFDSIEFSDVLRWIDVASDVAFVAMDLASRGREDLAAIVTSSWIEAANDHDATGVLPLYLVHRAIVRSVIAAIRGSQPDADSSAAHAESDRYLDLAEQLAVQRQPMLYVTCGVSGCGKTTLARQLVASTGAIHLRSDVERKRAFGMAPTDRPETEESRSALYSPAATQQTYERLAWLARTMLRNGTSVVIDAACTARWQRDLLTHTARDAGIPLTWIAPEISEAKLIARVDARHHSGHDASDATTDVLRSQLDSFEPITEEELQAQPNTRVVRTLDSLYPKSDTEEKRG
jgi:aminoglycoside phosphotransferase family enzyme/predicted kinase